MNKEKLESSIISFFKSDIIQEFSYSSIGCIFFIILYSFFPKQYWNETNRTTILLILTLSFFFVFIILNQFDSNKSFFKVNYKRNIILFSIFNFAAYLFLFYNAHWGYAGLASDNFYRTAYITQMAYSGYPQDFAYKGLSAFYAPFYWYCLALISRVFQIPSYKMIRVGLLITCYILPIVLFEMWKKIYSEKLAFVITLLTSNVLNIYDIDHVITALLFIPFFMYYFENCTNKEFAKKDYIMAGIIGSILFCIYFFYFIIIPIYYFITLIQDKNKFKDNLKHIFFIIIFIILFSSWFWAPLLKDILLIGFESHQNKYFHPNMLTYPLLHFIGFNIWIIGLVYIFRKYKLSPDLKVLGNLLLSIHIGFLIGFIGILIDFPLMHWRLFLLSTYILRISYSIFYVRFFIFLVDNDVLKRYKLNLNLYQVEIYYLIFIVIIQAFAHLNWISRSSGYDYAHEGNSMAYERDIIEELDYEDKIFLTSEWRVAMFLPIYLFLLPKPYFNHPSALYNQRIEFLIELSECNSSKEFHKKIINNKFDPIDYFYLDLKDNSTILRFVIIIEDFPNESYYEKIEFKRELFQDEKYFEEIEIDGEIIYRTKY